MAWQRFWKGLGLSTVISILFWVGIFIAVSGFVNATDYYYGNLGNDANDCSTEALACSSISDLNGKALVAGDRVLFNCTSSYRLTPSTAIDWLSGNSSAYITYTSYGTCGTHTDTYCTKYNQSNLRECLDYTSTTHTQKPLFMASINASATSDWTDQGGNIWRYRTNVSKWIQIYCNETPLWSIHYRQDLDQQGEFAYNKTDAEVFIYSTTNPATYCSGGLELATGSSDYTLFALDGHDYIHVNGLELKYSAYHCLTGGTSNNNWISNNTVSYCGGAGGLIYNTTYSVSSGDVINITVGIGGQGGISYGVGTNGTKGSNGSNSSFGTLIAIGGGGGAQGNNGSSYPGNGSIGGSGGGGNFLGKGGLGTTGQGNDGGNSSASANAYGAGGGGGAGGIGGTGTNTIGGAGGIGINYSISNTTVCYAGGGAGAVYNVVPATAICGGGNGARGTGGTPINAGNGTNGTGGGGGGSERASNGKGGDGGTGIVIILYQISSSTPPTSSCTCPGAGNPWAIDFGDNCNITSACSCSDLYVKDTHTGTWFINNTITASGTVNLNMSNGQYINLTLATAGYIKKV